MAALKMGAAKSQSVAHLACFERVTMSLCAAAVLFHITAFVFAMVREVDIHLDKSKYQSQSLNWRRSKIQKFIRLGSMLDLSTFFSPWHYPCCHPLSVQRALGVTMCDTLPPAPLSVRPSVRLSGLALAFALKRITIVIINASLCQLQQCCCPSRIVGRYRE